MTADIAGKEPRVLAFDLGASSGRAVLGVYREGKIQIEEVHRFSNDPVLMRGTLYWDFPRLLHEIKQGMVAARDRGGFDSIGIDTWGVDFGLLDREGRLLENPVHYRDLRTDGIPEEVFRTIPKRKVYEATGIQIMPLNTLFQLYSIVTRRPDLKERIARVLFMPDLLNYFLTGAARTEYTIASTSGMLVPREGVWSPEMSDRLGIPSAWFSPLIDPGTVVGSLSPEVCRELSLPEAKVVAVASHDTASAVIAVPSEPGEDTVYISSGTWSVLGIERPRPIIDDRSYAFNFSNEGGYGRNTRFLKNIMGLWLIQETRRQWIREGNTLSYADMERAALGSEPFRSFVDPDHPMFAPVGDMPGRIRAFCRETGQPEPGDVGEVTRCVYESLALKYRQVEREAEELAGHAFSCLRIVGGGVKDGLLSQFAADATGLRVVAGPIEATALGNVAVQLVASGVFDSIDAARAAIRASFDCITYLPDPARTPAWDEAAMRFDRLKEVAHS